MDGLIILICVCLSAAAGKQDRERVITKIEHYNSGGSGAGGIHGHHVGHHGVGHMHPHTNSS